MTLPHLRTTRLDLVPVGDEHLAQLIQLNSDPEVMRYLLGRPATPEETRREWDQRRRHQSDERRGLGYWVGFTHRQFVGWWSASAFVPDTSLAGLGYRLRRQYWGLGFATEGARAMLDQAFSVPGVERAVASTMAVNTGSRSVLAKLGMEHVDTVVEEWDDPIPGWEEGDVTYEITRKAWLDR